MPVTAYHQHIAQLLFKRSGEGLSPAEQAELDSWTEGSPKRSDFVRRMEGDMLLSDFKQVQKDSGKDIETLLYQRIQAGIAAQHEASTGQAARIIHRVHFLKSAWFRYAAVLLLIGGAAIILYKTNQPQKPIAQQAKPLTLPDILPGGNKALLTLSDGSTVALDSVANGAIAQQGNAHIIKLSDGQIAYNLEGLPKGRELLNTMSTPKGGQYQLTLPDGTKVWLNAASSITYPAVFVGATRSVSITGEVYFEIMKAKASPFTVHAKNEKIEVLGTSFNVKAYQEDAAARTTLLTGSLKINQTILKPGQAFMNSKVVTADTEQDIAWKNGLFNFENQSVEQVMPQLARWYDLEIVYEGKIPDIRFFGKISRDLPLADVLKALEQTKVRFRIEEPGRKIVILP